MYTYAENTNRPRPHVLALSMNPRVYIYNTMIEIPQHTRPAHVTSRRSCVRCVCVDVRIYTTHTCMYKSEHVAAGKAAMLERAHVCVRHTTTCFSAVATLSETTQKENIDWER